MRAPPELSGAVKRKVKVQVEYDPVYDNWTVRERPSIWNLGIGSRITDGYTREQALARAAEKLGKGGSLKETVTLDIGTDG